VAGADRLAVPSLSWLQEIQSYKIRRIIAPVLLLTLLFEGGLLSCRVEAEAEVTKKKNLLGDRAIAA
jgi:hypothetical protein